MFCKLISMVDMSVTSVQSIIADLSYFKASWKFQLLQCWPSIIGQLDEQVVLEKLEMITLSWVLKTPVGCRSFMH